MRKKERQVAGHARLLQIYYMRPAGKPHQLPLFERAVGAWFLKGSRHTSKVNPTAAFLRRPGGLSIVITCSLL